MARCLLVLLTVALLISCVYSALSCYNCKGNKDEVCEVTVNCGQSANPNQQAACLKRITKESTGTVVKRSCTFVSAPNFDKAVECRADDVECVSCKEDKCNSAPSLVAKFSIYATLAVLAPVLFLR